MRRESAEFNRRSAQRATDKQVLAKWRRLQKAKPKRRRGESRDSWLERVETHAEVVSRFVAINRQRLHRLGIAVPEAGPGESVVPEHVDARHAEAEEEETLRRLADRGPPRFEKLG